MLIPLALRMSPRKRTGSWHSNGEAVRRVSAAVNGPDRVWSLVCRHPDKNKGSQESKEKFQEITDAYKCLTDPDYKDDDGDMTEEQMQEMAEEMFEVGNPPYSLQFTQHAGFRVQSTRC